MNSHIAIGLFLLWTALLITVGHNIGMMVESAFIN
jgi:hypothetical protein